MHICISYQYFIPTLSINVYILHILSTINQSYNNKLNLFTFFSTQFLKKHQKQKQINLQIYLRFK